MSKKSDRLPFRSGTAHAFRMGTFNKKIEGFIRYMRQSSEDQSAKRYWPNLKRHVRSLRVMIPYKLEASANLTYQAASYLHMFDECLVYFWQGILNDASPTSRVSEKMIDSIEKYLEVFQSLFREMTQDVQRRFLSEMTKID